jgi:hypothetical protein
MDTDLRTRFDAKTTEELVQLLRAHDLAVWRPEVFPMVEAILQERGVDLAAVKAEPGPDDSRSEEPMDFVRLVDLPDPTLLAAAKSLLEGAGLEYFIKNESTQSLFGAGQIGGYNFITGPPVLMVDASRLEEAQELLAPLLGEAAPAADDEA